MPQVRFTEAIQRHVACPAAEVAGSTVRDVLDAYFADHPAARGYVLDDQAALRHHMAIFVDGRPVLDRSRLSDAVRDGASVDVMQALSGG